MSGGMNVELTEDRELTRKSVAELAVRFDDQYRMEKAEGHEARAQRGNFATADSGERPRDERSAGQSKEQDNA